jgi:hypothetical protein
MDSTTRPQTSNQLHESSDSEDSDVVEYQRSTHIDFEPSERTLRKHVPGTNIQGKCHDTTKERSSAKRMKQEDSPIEDFYQGYVEQDSMKRLSGKKVKKHAEVPQTTQQSMESRSPRGFSGHLSPNEMAPRNPCEDTTNPPI